MNIDFEKVPRSVFEWVERVSFRDLSEAQRNEVLTHFGQEDYEEMHHAFQSVHVNSLMQEGSSNIRKTMLLNHFDRQQEIQRMERRSSRHLVVWQAAAVILMMLAGWLFYQVFDFRKKERSLEVASTDTVYVTKEVNGNPEIIHDTVYRYQTVQEERESESYSKEDVAHEGDQNMLRDTGLIPVLELENLNSSPKGNSMRDDSLLKKFEFVAM